MAYRAVAVDSGFAVLHPHLGGVLHLPLGFALEAVGFHCTSPYRQLINAENQQAKRGQPW